MTNNSANKRMQPESRHMNSDTNWALFYRFDGDLPREFHEIRLFDTIVWTATGNALTWGEHDTQEYADADSARSEFAAACQKAESQGFTPTRHGVFDPHAFDFDALTNEIREGARKAFEAVRKAHPDHEVNSYALFSDDSAMTIGHVANSKEALAEIDEEEDDKDDYIWNSAEWSFDEGSEYLDIAYRMILPRHRDIPWEIEFEEFRDGVFEACIKTLEQLDQEEFFGTRDSRADVILLFQVSDSDEIEGAVERLNTPAAFARYKTWYESWN